MLQSWRWFGHRDPVSLGEIRQAGVSGIVTALHDIPCGELWPLKAVEDLRDHIRSSAPGLCWEVVESLPVHEDIKTQTGPWRQRLETYRQSLANLGRAGIKTVCYNFMPVLDWTRTDLSYPLPDGSTVLRYDEHMVALFDVFLLKRRDAHADYTDDCLARAEAAFASLSEPDRDRVCRAILLGLPGTVNDLTLAEFREMLGRYAGIDEDQLRSNLHDFLASVIPIAEEHGIRMAIHPDDPPWTIFGLPRIMNRREHLRMLFRAIPSTSNGLTFCTGSLGASSANDTVDLLREFAPRVYFAHLRNISLDPALARSFNESPSHLEGTTDMVALMKVLLEEEVRRRRDGDCFWRIPVRPDHGRLLARDMEEDAYPGYSSTGRMIGLAELRGIEKCLTSHGNSLL